MKYKLIKEYPGSPKLGAIVIPIKNGNVITCYRLENAQQYLAEQIALKKERDNKIIILVPTREDYEWVKESFNLPFNWKDIKKGDFLAVIVGKNIKDYIINPYWWGLQEYLVLNVDQYAVSINEEPVDITFDGKRLYKGMYYWFIDKNGFVQKGRNPKLANHPVEEIFSTKEAAQRYLKEKSRESLFTVNGRTWFLEDLIEGEVYYIALDTGRYIYRHNEVIGNTWLKTYALLDIDSKCFYPQSSLTLIHRPILDFREAKVIEEAQLEKCERSGFVVDIEAQKPIPEVPKEILTVFVELLKLTNDKR